MSTRTNYSSGRTYENRCGYSRAVRIDNPKSIICVGGTTATTHDGDILCKGDAYGQTREALKIVKTALEELGGTLEDVVRTRLYVVDIAANQDDVCKAHYDVFSGIRPSETLIGVAGLSHPDMLVEVEVDAIL